MSVIFDRMLKTMVWHGTVDGFETAVYLGGVVVPGDQPATHVEVVRAGGAREAAAPEHAARAVARALYHRCFP